MPLLVACPKKELPAIVDATPAPAPVEQDSAPLILTTLEEDAGVDAAPDAAKKATGPGISTNVARLRQCCTQLRTQARAMGASPEAGMLIAAAGQCDGLASQAGLANAPELSLLKTALAGRNLPPVCAGF